jgi:hypothetical protein
LMDLTSIGCLLVLSFFADAKMYSSAAPTTVSRSIRAVVIRPSGAGDIESCVKRCAGRAVGV